MLSRNASLPVEEMRQNTDPRSVLLLPNKRDIPCPVYVAISESSFVIRKHCPSVYNIVCPTSPRPISI